nr:unnamed protein product [Callosobruchus chinensis]
MTEAKRRPPESVQKILKFDSNVTNHFVTLVNKHLPFMNSLKMHYQALEISCHGIPWFAFWIAFTWLFNNAHLVQMQVNMLLGLTTDIIFVAIAKAYFRRKRPITNTNDPLGQMGPDIYSFPSGHASRSVFVAYFFLVLYPFHFVCYPPILAWTTCICLSRILMRRHYILDVIAGICLGLLNGLLVGWLWIGQDTALWMINYISDDKLDGGEFHV